MHGPHSEGIERVVLLGFMLSGKSTVGEALARRLEWEFIDFDVEIERRDGRPVSRIIAEEGEAYFRGREAEITVEVGRRSGLVMAPGGGWITNPELLLSLPSSTFAVWLRVSAEEIVRRLRADPGDRPFRDHTEPLATIRRMLEEREPLYALADLKVPGEGRSMESAAFEIEQLVRGRGLGVPG